MIFAQVVEALPGSGHVLISEGSTPWAYLGRYMEMKKRAERSLGRESCVSLADRAQETAQMLMMPYVEAVGHLSTRQEDAVNWFASKFASRSIWQTKFFQRLVMTRLALELIHTGALGHRYMLVIEDPWVFEALQRASAQEDGPCFIGRPRLWSLRIRNAIVSPFKRIGLACYMSLFRLIVHTIYSYRGRSATQPPCGDVALHSYLEARTILSDGQYRDEYLGILGEIVEADGLRIVRVSQLLYPWRLTDRAARNATIWPLILSLSYRSIWQCLFKRWRAVGLEHLEIPGLPRDALWVLLEEERMAESGAGYMVNWLTYAAYSAYFDRKPAEAVVYPFENQPWEKLLCCAARSRDSAVRLVGFQQSTVARFFVHFFRSRWEEERFFPDRILVGGKQFAELLVAGGWNKERLAICGALRHVEAFRATPVYLPDREPPVGGCVVVALPVDTELTREILTSLRLAFPDGGRSDSIRFCVRFHPAGVDSFFSEFSDWLSCVEIDIRPYVQTLKDESVACVLTAMGVSGLEALFMGLQVARFRTELGIDIDPLDQYEGDGVRVVNGSSLRSVLLDLVDKPHRPHPNRLSALLSYIAPPDAECVINALRTASHGR